MKSRNPIAKAVRKLHQKIIPNKKKYHRETIIDEDYNLPNDCCIKCSQKRSEKEIAQGRMPTRLFITCPLCGNKRCPKATDHNNACTNSNEPGQPGSAYQ